MNNTRYKSDWAKFIVGWIVVFAIRLIPFRPPNIEGVMATMMPFAKRYGITGGFVFGFLSIAIFDLAVGKVGTWTLITGAAYGLLGMGAYLFFKNRPSTSVNYLKYAIAGTILYDAVTGLSIGPLFFGQPFMEALLGQIPFTAMHLLGNAVLAVTASPLIYRLVVANRSLEAGALWQKFRVMVT
jgi:uncharacterized membrane protein